MKPTLEEGNIQTSPSQNIKCVQLLDMDALEEGNIKYIDTSSKEGFIEEINEYRQVGVGWGGD